MKVVYIAGPYRGPNAWAIEQNIRRAEEMALRVWQLGAAALCPHTNTRFFQGAAEDRVWLDGDIEMLKRCDAMLAIDGWTKSEGAKAEVAIALLAHMPVFENLFSLEHWLSTEVL